MSVTPLLEAQALKELEIAIQRLSDYHTLNMASFVYGFLLGRGCSDEFATIACDKYDNQ